MKKILLLVLIFVASASFGQVNSVQKNTDDKNTGTSSIVKDSTIVINETSILKSSADVKDINSIYESADKIYKSDSVEQKPEFPGGINKFLMVILKNFQVPKVEGLSGKIVVQFVVDIDGSLTDFMVLRDVGFGAGKEAIRVMKLAPKWIPGKQNGKEVRCSYIVPINIQ